MKCNKSIFCWNGIVEGSIDGNLLSNTDDYLFNRTRFMGILTRDL